MTDPDPASFVDLGRPGALRARINLHGAELWQLIDADGADLLWPGDPQVWNGRAPILFPIVGSLAGGAYRYRGSSYALGRHGFARHSRFSLVERHPDRALLRLEASAATRALYPFEFRLDLAFSTSGGALDVAVSVANLGAETMPFSFGFHPALRWPLEPGAPRAGHVLTFAEPEASPISKLDDQGLVKPAPEPTPVVDRQLALRDGLFAADALIFTELASRCVDYGAQHDGKPSGRHIRIDFDNLSLVGVWTKPGAGYVCIEPWQGMADPQDFAGDIFAKPGIVALAPNGTWHARMVLTPVPPA